MVSILRRIPITLSGTAALSKLLMMDSSNGRSERLSAIAQQLRLYKPPPCFDETEEQSIEESNGKVVSQVGFPESTTPIARDPEKFKPKRAAVLICLFEGDGGDLRVILTKRSSTLSTHSGEVALPGGKADEEDKDDGETAKREANEEIGLDPSLVNVVTVLEPFLSKVTTIADLMVNLLISQVNEYLKIELLAKFSVLDHLVRVVPVIGILHDRHAFKPVPNPCEVDAVFDAPLEMFLKDENRREEEREWIGHKYLIHYFDYETEKEKYLIWGLTAGILIRAASVVYQRPPAFLQQNPKFKFPRVLKEDSALP